MSYAVPVNECTLADIRRFRQEARDAGIRMALNHGLAATAEQLVVRQGLPFTDFGAGAVGWTIEQYRNPAIAAAGWGSVFDAGALPANVPQLANTKVAVFYKYSNYSAAPTMLGLRFRTGATGASTLATYHYQLILGAKLEPEMYFTEPVVYEPNDWVYIEGYYNGAVGALGEAFAFECFIVERLGATVS